MSLKMSVNHSMNQTVVLASAIICSIQHITPLSYYIIVYMSILSLLEIGFTSFEYENGVICIAAGTLWKPEQWSGMNTSFYFLVERRKGNYNTN